MNEYANSLKETLTSLIREMSAVPAPYVKNPEKILPERPRRLCNEVGRLAAMVYRSPIQGKPL